MEGGRQLAVVHLVVVRAEEGARHGRAEERFAPARLRAAQPFRRDARLLLEPAVETQLLHVVLAERHDQGAFAAEVDRQAGRRLHLRREILPHRPAQQDEMQEGVLSGLVLHPAGQHAGRRGGAR